MEERTETRTRNKQEQRCEQVPIQSRQCTSTVIEQPPLVSLISILKKKTLMSIITCRKLMIVYCDSFILIHISETLCAVHNRFIEVDLIFQ